MKEKSYTSYHGDPEFKAKILAQLQAHYEADEIIKGQYWEDGKGCAVGCLIHGDDHSKFPDVLGWPEWLARLVDDIFEGLPNADAKEFVLQIGRAVPDGKDEDWFNQIKWRFFIFLLEENYKRVECLKLEQELKEKVLAAISKCKAVNLTAIKLGQLDESARSAAKSAESAESAESAAYQRYRDELLRLLEGEG